MTNFKGKAIYNPQGKAAEYSKWAVNFYVGCSNACIYCYCKKGILAGVMGQNKPQLKKCFNDKWNAIEVFEHELMSNAFEIRKHGLFFSFTTDPMLPETIDLTQRAVFICDQISIPVKILTKTAWWDDPLCWDIYVKPYIGMQISFGFSLTGHDELEPSAATNQERIEAMKKLHDLGFKTFASIEPIIDVKSSYEMIERTHEFCDLYKIGPESGKKYSINDLRELFARVNILLACRSKAKVYWKDGYLKLLGLTREDCLSLTHCAVPSDYNIFES